MADGSLGPIVYEYAEMTVHEVRNILRRLVDLRPWDLKEIEAWSNHRMKRNRVAKSCH